MRIGKVGGLTKARLILYVLLLSSPDPRPNSANTRQKDPHTGDPPSLERFVWRASLERGDKIDWGRSKDDIDVKKAALFTGCEYILSFFAFLTLLCNSRSVPD